MQIKTFTDLLVWQKAHLLGLDIYRLTLKFLKSEQFSLSSQLRRAAVSITSNIAERFGRQSYGERVKFYNIASGSLTEVNNQLIIARDVGYLREADLRKLSSQADEFGRILGGLLKKSRLIRDS
jgi:four helix bundle protein